jgi:hypothetical protein
MELTLAALTWDPQIRGAVIVLAAVLILPGSVYLLLSTNVGAKLGFLLALAGLTGWMAVMGVIWTVYGIGLRGDDPHWKVLEVVTGDVSRSTVEEVGTFPRGWEKLQAGNAILGDAQAAADKALVPETDAGGHGEEGGGGGEAAHVEPVFKKAEDHTVVAGYRTGGEDYFVPGGYLERSSGPLEGWLHQPHYVVIQVRPVLPQPAPEGGAPPPPVADTTKPLTSVVMLRDLGSVRFPSFVLALAMTIVFAVVCNVLHRRDKEVMAARALGPAVQG